MKRILSFLLLCLVVAGTALAQDFTPTANQPYFIYCNANSRYVLYNSACTQEGNSAINILSSWSNFDHRSLFLISGNASEGYIIKTASETLSSTFYIYAVSVEAGNACVGLKQLADENNIPDDCKWDIVAQGNGWNIKPKGSETSWKYTNDYNGNAQTGLTATLTENATIWSILTANDQMTEKLNEAQTLLNNTPEGLAYPTQNARNAFQSAITSAQSISLTTVNEENVTNYNNAYNQLKNAITTFSSTTDVIYPENGKAYTFTYINAAGNKAYLNWNGTTITATRLNDSKAIPNSGIFICRKVTENEVEKFVFVNSVGKYLVWQCDESKYNITDALTGHLDDYTTHCNWNLVLKSSINTAGEKQYPGKFLLEGKKKDGSLNYLLVNTSKATPTFHSCQAGQSYHNNNLSSFCLIEEVSYPNNVTLNQAVGIDAGDQNIATFSAPFATVVPEGVTAYIVSEAGNTAKMTEFATTGQAIPANTGVLLYGTATSALMVPATSETQAALAGNQINRLGNSAGAAKDMSTVQNAYILGKPVDTDKVAFYRCNGGTLGMNKAYLDLGTQGAAALEIDFGGETTGLTNLNVATEKASPVFDLSGRRVTNVQKGGLYIQNGKKFIVK